MPNTQYRVIPDLPSYEISENGKVRNAEGKVMPRTIVNATEVVTIEDDLFVVSRLTSNAWGAKRNQSCRFRQPR